MKSHPALKVAPALAAIAIASACGGGALDPDAVSSDSQAIGDIVLLNFDLGSALGSPVRTGNTCGAYNQWSPYCVPNSAASDNTFWWRAPYAGTFNFTTSGSSYDTVLHLYNNSTGVLLACNDDWNGTTLSSLTLTLAAGQQIRIVVDGYSSLCGGYSLNISGTPIPPSQFHWTYAGTENCYDLIGGPCSGRNWIPNCPLRPVHGKACSVSGNRCWSVASSQYVEEYECVPN